MTHFSAGEKVMIRYGKHQGQTAIIVKIQPGDAYRVKAEDGTILFFSSKGLATCPTNVPALIPSTLPLVGKQQRS